MDSSSLAKSALADGVVLAPGNVFSPSLSKGNFMRFNVSQMENRAFGVLETALREECDVKN